MMGVYISNMSKPKSCYLCTFRIIDPTDGSVCGCVVGHIQGIPLDQDRADDCPIEEVDDIAFGLYKAYIDGIGGERGLDPNNCKECEVDECDRHICLKAVRERRKE